MNEGEPELNATTPEQKGLPHCFPSWSIASIPNSTSGHQNIGAP